MLQYLPLIWDFFCSTVTQYWQVVTGCSVLAGFVTLMTNLGTVVTKALGFIPTITGVIMNDPLLLMCTGFLFLGGCIGIIGRLLSRN